MGTLWLGVGALTLGLILVLGDWWEEFGVFNLGFGLLFLFQGFRQRARSARFDRQFLTFAKHADEASARMHRGESPQQIADAFEQQFQIPPVISLYYMANDRLNYIGRGREFLDTLAVKAWLSLDARELADPEELIAGFAGPRNLFATLGKVSIVGSETQGALVAARTHLFFFHNPNPEKFGREVLKDMAVNALPPVVGYAQLLRDLFQGVRGEVRSYDAALVKELTQRFALPASFAIPWRRVQQIGKLPLHGSNPPEVHLLIKHGEEAAPTELRLRLGSGLNEATVDVWVDIVRVACVLEGKLLLF